MTIIEYNDKIKEIKSKLWRDALAKIKEADENAADGSMQNEQRFYDAGMLLAERLAKLQYVSESSSEYFKID